MINYSKDAKLPLNKIEDVLGLYFIYFIPFFNIPSVPNSVAMKRKKLSPHSKAEKILKLKVH